MNPALLSALSALGGSLIGATAPVITTWLTQRGQYLAQHRVSDRTRRETLYAEFITEASTRYADAVQAEDIDIRQLVTLLALVNRIRLYGEAETVAQAEKVMDVLLDTYLAPPIDLRQIRASLDTRPHDPLLDFSRQARMELLRLR